jgi:predicted small lipoprotein YifL
MRTSTILLFLLFLGACGTRTSLTLPPSPAPAGAAKTTAPQTPPADDSKAGGNAAR